MDWLSRLLDIMPVRGRLDLRCMYGAPWRINQGPAKAREIAYHIVLSGSAVLEDPMGGPPKRLFQGDILLLPDGGEHVLHDGGGLPAVPATARAGINVTYSENAGTGDRLDLLCGHFILAAPHDRLLRDVLPARLIARSTSQDTSVPQSDAAVQVAGLVALMRAETAVENLGGHAMLNALSTALFALTLRLASEAQEAPVGVLALAGNPRLLPALTAMFREPSHPWTLPELARLCHMSRSTIARQFQEKLGRSANDLLTDIRMTLAAAELKKSSASTGAVSEAVGYQSEAAFQRAFKQRMGMTPARWRRTAQSPDPASDE